MAWFIRRVALIAFPIVEFLLIFWLAGVIGWGWVLLILAGGVVAAVLLLRLAGRNVFSLLTDPRRTGQSFTSVDPGTGETTTMYQPPVQPDAEQAAEDVATVRESGLLVTAAGLLAFPGLISDAAGLILALPPVRRALAKRRTPYAERVTVIRGETVVVDDATPDVAHWKDTAAGGGPPQVISGEILPPKED